MTVAETEKFAGWLTERNISSAYYHGKMNSQDRTVVQRQWTQGDVKVIVATCAFGMGIDKSDVRFVVHHTIPKSLEEYYQESGRAGRDGQSAHCLLMFAPADKQKITRLIQSAEATEDQEPRKQVMQALIKAMADYAMELVMCRRVLLLGYFDEEFDATDCGGMCDHCRRNTPLVTVDYTHHARNLASLVGRIVKTRRWSPFPTLKHLENVYLGRRIQNVIKCGDDKLPEFGKGAELKKAPMAIIHKLMDELVSRKVVTPTSYSNEHGVVNYFQPGEQFDSFKRHDFAPVELQEPVLVKSALPSSEGVTLYDQLRPRWARIDGEKKARPKTVVPSSVLRQIAIDRPTTVDELAQVRGITDRFVEMCGVEVVEIVARSKGDSPAVPAQQPLPLALPVVPLSTAVTVPESQSQISTASAIVVALMPDRP
jgi:bloom syndrome protein